jgi:lysozyme family protein
MISRYNEFLLEKEFNLIVDDIFRLVESEGVWTSPNTIEWDMTKKEEPQTSKDWVDRTIERLSKFVKSLSKEKAREYFVKLLNKLKPLPELTRRYLITHYTSVFLTVASLAFLFSYQDDTSVSQDPTQTVKVEKVEKIDPQIEQEVVELTKKSSFEEAQNSVKEVEAGFSDDRGDSGNYIEVTGGKRFLGTNHGISAPVLQKWMQDQGIKRLPTKEDMMNLSYKTALEIYKKDYWDAQKLTDLCNQNVANIVYDGCVNQGIDAMNEIITNALSEQGVKVKGWCFTNKGISKMNSCNQQQLFDSIKKGRESRYKQAPTWSRHGEGWMNRLNSIEFVQA